MDDLLRHPVRPEHDRPAQDLTRHLLGSAALAGILAALAGCGSGAAESVAPGEPPSPTGTLGIAIPGTPRTFDPLYASMPADLLVAAQTYEPLTRAVSGPYDRGGRKPGLALAVDPRAGGTIWTLRLRTGVRFQDGARFNATSVLANAARWRSSSEGRALLPGLAAVDAPKPDVARFFFSAPHPGLVRELASPRLGIVSPRVLRSDRALARLPSGLAAGTGPFELHDRREGRVLLARNQRWWGTRHDLGPGVEVVAVRFVPAAERRLGLLRRSVVEVAAGLSRAQAVELRRDPLFAARAGAGATVVGLERSVRGLGALDEPPALSRAWLTTIDGAT